MWESRRLDTQGTRDKSREKFRVAVRRYALRISLRKGGRWASCGVFHEGENLEDDMFPKSSLSARVYVFTLVAPMALGSRRQM